MQVYRIKTNEFKRNFSVNTVRVQQDTYGILYCFTGCASADKIYRCFEKELMRLSETLKIDLSTQLCINVHLNSNGTYKGYSVIYVSNDIAYCLLLGLDSVGQKVVLESVDKKITINALKKVENMLLNSNLKDFLQINDNKRFDLFKESISKNKKVKKILITRLKNRFLTFDFINEYSSKNEDKDLFQKLMNLWYAESMDRIDNLSYLASTHENEDIRHGLQGMIDFFEDTYSDEFINTPDSYKQPKYVEASYKYTFTEQDKDMLGSVEKTKSGIVGNLGTITVILPSESRDNNRILITRVDHDLFDIEFFENLFGPFPVTNIVINDTETHIEFENNKACFLANLLCKTVIIDNTVLTFEPPNLNKYSFKKKVSFNK